jgi:hypothetical protein
MSPKNRKAFMAVAAPAAQQFGFGGGGVRTPTSPDAQGNGGKRGDVSTPRTGRNGERREREVRTLWSGLHRICQAGPTSQWTLDPFVLRTWVKRVGWRRGIGKEERAHVDRCDWCGSHRSATDDNVWLCERGLRGAMSGGDVAGHLACAVTSSSPSFSPWLCALHRLTSDAADASRLPTLPASTY